MGWVRSCVRSVRKCRHPIPMLIESACIVYSVYLNGAGALLNSILKYSGSRISRLDRSKQKQMFKKNVFIAVFLLLFVTFFILAEAPGVAREICLCYPLGTTGLPQKNSANLVQPFCQL